jgi:SAM-dependent methyltransferase
MLHSLRIAIPIALAVWLMMQVRNPRGWLGRRVARAMNVSHSSLTDWGLEDLHIAANATILDIGCGGGRTVQKLASRTPEGPEGKVVGVDLSLASVAVARETNAEAIAAGRVQIEHASVAALPFSDCTFDLITAVETHYYWPDLQQNFREVLRVLKPGGTFALIAETYRGGPFRFVYGIVMPLLRAAFLSDQEHRDLLARAGFVDVSTKHLRGHNWIVATGRRPA